MCVLSHFSCVWLFVTPRTVARQAPLSVGFSRQGYGTGLPRLPWGDLPDPGIKPTCLPISCIGRWVLYHGRHLGSPDLTNSLKRSKNANFCSKADIIHLWCIHLTYFCLYSLYLFHLFGAKVAEKLILQLEILSCGYDWKGHRLILGTGWTPREAQSGTSSLTLWSTQWPVHLPGWSKLLASVGLSGLCVPRARPTCQASRLSNPPGSRGPGNRAPGAVWTCPGQRGADWGAASGVAPLCKLKFHLEKAVV